MEKLYFAHKIFYFICLQMPDKMSWTRQQKCVLVTEFLRFIFRHRIYPCLDCIVDILRALHFRRRTKQHFFAEWIARWKLRLYPFYVVRNLYFFHNKPRCDFIYYTLFAFFCQWRWRNILLNMQNLLKNIDFCQLFLFFLLIFCLLSVIIKIIDNIDRGYQKN